MTGERGHRAGSFVVLLVLAPYFPMASGQILQKYGCGRLPKQSGRKVKAAGKVDGTNYNFARCRHDSILHSGPPSCGCGLIAPLHAALQLPRWPGGVRTA
jgi:hypothetical protein